VQIIPACQSNLLMCTTVELKFSPRNVCTAYRNYGDEFNVQISNLAVVYLVSIISLTGVNSNSFYGLLGQFFGGDFERC
jgi:hypothetical protein